MSNRVIDLINGLSKNTLECIICLKHIHKTDEVWSCSQCYVIFHLSCVKTWATQLKKTESTWRCPGCQYLFFVLPCDYRCFCSKVISPHLEQFMTPHSCGQICGRVPAQECVHGCTLLCHPGPCPPCSATGKARHCPCGKTTYYLRCGQTELVPRTCNNICKRVLSCNKHQCSQKCHLNECNTCLIKENQKCFCGRIFEKRDCGSGYEITISQNKDKKNFKRMSFSCQKECGKKLNCNNHFCKQICHIGPCNPCTRQPINPQPCGCGKTFQNFLRKSCLDPFPTCDNICLRPSICGKDHLCRKKCHDGECPCCEEIIALKCRCGRHTFSVLCNITTNNKNPRIKPNNANSTPYTITYSSNSKIILLCKMICNRKLSCLRHRCRVVCCPEYNQDYQENVFVHSCGNLCNKSLSCDKHKCDAFCHSGNCPECGIVIREGISCSCGKTKLHGPVQCGTILPECPFPCKKTRDCGHSCVYTCHPGDCPPCIQLTKKQCVGGHQIMRNIPCHVKNITCDRICNKKQTCEVHTCRRMCHSGNCLFQNPTITAHLELYPLSCGQECRLLRACGHKCKYPCHVPLSCDECTSYFCSEEVENSCECRRIKKMIPCGYRGGGDNENQKLLDNRILISCDEICSREERNKRLRDAFSINRSDDDNKIQFVAFSEKLLNKGASDISFLLRIEKQYETLIHGSKKTLHLPVMSTQHRALVCALAHHYMLDSEELDAPPKRSVRLTKTPFSTIPNPLLSVACTHQNNNNQFHTIKTVEEWPLSNRVLYFYHINSSSDLYSYLKPWETQGKCRINFLNKTNAIALFSDDNSSSECLSIWSKSMISKFKIQVWTGSIDEINGKQPANNYNDKSLKAETIILKDKKITEKPIDSWYDNDEIEKLRISENQKWVCEDCTFLNEDKSDFCNCCDKKRILKWEKFGSWYCKNCTFRNPSDATICEMCKQEKPFQDEKNELNIDAKKKKKKSKKIDQTNIGVINNPFALLKDLNE